jgi:hypothetical protein
LGPTPSSKRPVHGAGPEATWVNGHRGEARRPHRRERIPRLGDSIDEVGIDLDAGSIPAEIAYTKITDVDARCGQGGTQRLLRKLHAGETR